MVNNIDALPAGEAKKEYFLTSADLVGLPFESLSFGFGTGRPTRLYEPEVLERAALRKYGAMELEKKRKRREKREENLRKKEQEALKEEIRLFNTENEAPGVAQGGATMVADEKAIATIRKAVTNELRKLATWNRVTSPNGCTRTARVLGVQQAEFAALIGRPTDPELKSLVKRGAWYSDIVNYKTVLGTTEPIFGRGGRDGCNSELGISPDEPMTVKYCPGSKTLSISAFVVHQDAFITGF